MANLCLGVFDVIEVATILGIKATIALLFQSSLIARSANLALVFKPAPRGIKKDALLWAADFFLFVAITPQPPHPTRDFITFGFGVNSHCQRKGFSQLFTPRF